MFWGLIMEPQRRYTQKVKKAFHISMAALDLSTSSTEPAQVMCGFEGRNYLLCTLKKPEVLQCPLNLNFEVGSEVSFAANGRCHIHLTGYLNEDYTDLVEEEEEEEVEETVVKKGISSKPNKRVIKGTESGPPKKKSKNGVVTSSQEQDEDDSDDSNYVKDLFEKSFDEDEDDTDASVEEEEDEGEEGEEEEDEDLEEEEDESSLSGVGSDGEEEEVEEEEEVKPKVNGLSASKASQNDVQKKKKDKKNKDKQQVEPVKKSPQQQKKEGKTPSKETQLPKKRSLQGGIIVEDIKEGQGAPAKNGKFVNVFYEGRLKQNNKMFDSTTKGTGFSFRLGSGEVIKGWDVGVAGMKVGGKRRITCPPAMAYGQKGSPPAIPPNSTLVFEVELRKIN